MKELADSLYRNFVDLWRFLVPLDLFTDSKENTELIEGVENWSYTPADYTIFDIVKNNIDVAGKFLEIGCGIPIFSYCIKKSFDNIKVTGLELNYRIVNYVESTVLTNEVNITQENAFEYQNYVDYDYLYCYTPIKDSDIMHKLVLTILSKMKKKAVLFLHNTQQYDIENYKDEIRKYATLKKLEDDYLWRITKK